MDKQLARAFLKVALLGQAARTGVYGLWMISRFKKLGLRLSPGTVYPTLRLLVAEGDIVPRKVVAGGKRRIVYTATPKGRAECKEVRRTITLLSRAFLPLALLVIAV